MDNAADAFLIAGGVLIAMIIVSTMMYMAGTLTKMEETNNAVKAAEQLAAFNAEYEAYNKKLMYGTDVMSVMNKAKNHNEKNPNSEITINAPYDYEYIKTNRKTVIFECTSVEYYDSTHQANGQIKSMTFEEI